MSFSGCMGFDKTYATSFIKEISGNRFICVSNYGFKMYSLNEKDEYSISLLEWYHEGLRSIIELDKNSFFFLLMLQDIIMIILEEKEEINLLKKKI